MKNTIQHNNKIVQQTKQAEQQEEQDITTLVDIVDENIEAIAELHMRAESNVSQHQRTIERITSLLGRPAFFYFTLVFVVLWITDNLINIRLGWHTFDPPPFYWLQGLVGLSALLVATTVLITQNRQQKLADQRRHLDLQVNLLVERKVTKLLALMDDLHHDLPEVEHKTDPQVEALKEPVDPQEIVHSLHNTWKQTSKEEV